MTSKASTPLPLQADGERVDAKKKDLGREDAPEGKNPSSIEDDTTASWDPYEYMPISLLTYFWVTPLIEKGYRRPLMQEDLPAVLEEDKAETLHRNLRLAWEREKIRAASSGTNKPKFWRALLASFNWGHTIFLVVSGGAKICAGIVLGLIIDFFSDANENGNANWGRGCLYALAMVGCIGVGAAGQHIYFFFGWRKGMNARIAAITVVYTQILNMRACVTAGKSTGHIVNLTSTDAERFSLATMFWPYLIFAPLEACVVLVILWYELGYGAIAGFAILLGIFLPIQFRFSKAYARLRFEAAHYTDQRVKLMSEVITGVRVMKCYAWEHAIADRVGRVRELESIAIKKTASLRGLNEGLYFSCPAIVGLVMFSVYIATGGTLTPRKVFVALTLILTIQLDMTKFFAFGVKETSEAIVAADRIGNFLLQVEEIVGENGGDLGLLRGSVGENGRESAYTLERGSTASLIGREGSVASVALPLKSIGTSTMLKQQQQQEEEPPSYTKRNTLPGKSQEGLPRTKAEGNIAISISRMSASWTNDSMMKTRKSHPSAPAMEEEEKKDEKSSDSIIGASSAAKPSLSPGIALEDIELNVPANKLVCVVGAVGCGKTSLLMAILGEMQANPKPFVAGKCAYVSQDPWVLSATIRENILFGLPYDSKKYNAVLEACCLKSDLVLFPNGDKTFVGERGVTLSGGQKARVSLARAAYSNSSIALLDDPLSAVDPNVGKQLFSRCVKGLMASRTTVLVTHQLQYAREGDIVVVMENGRIAAKGTFEQVQANRSLNLSKFLTSSNSTNNIAALKESGKSKSGDTKDSKSSPSPPANNVDSKNEEAAGGGLGKGTAPGSNNLTKLERSAASSAPGAAPLKAMKDMKTTKGKESAGADERKEDRQIGKVRLQTFKSYILAAGPVWLLTLLVIVTLGGQAILLLTSWYYARWSESSSQSSKQVIGIAGLLAGLCLFWSAFRAVWFMVSMVNASRKLHDEMFQSVVRLPARFFDVNPSGRVLNRFSKDVGFADDLMPWTFHDMVAIMLRVIAVVVLVCIINPVLFLAVLPLLGGFWYLQQRYIANSREIKRLEALSRSPVYSQISESLQGMVSIRAFDTQERFQKLFFEKVDRNVQGWFAFIASARWLGVRLDALTLFFTSCVLYAALLMQSQGFGISAGLVGLSLAYLVQLGDAFQWSVRQIAEFENQLISIERILEYIALDPEAPLDLPSDVAKIPNSWPTAGAIQFKNFSARYAKNLPLILRDVNLSIEGRSKVAIVGRTGAGKSSLTQCIFRLIEADGTASLLEIDGVNIGDIGLHPLRKAISIIPQSPWLFSGTIRQNLDPFDQYEDEAIWSALRDVQLRAVFETLQDPIAEFGGNLSSGQKQLVCLARAILCNSKILLCDEATANVDLKTDEIIQTTIRRKFSDSTVITIAHRLNTIIDVDTVVVLDQGHVVEVGDPFELLQRERDSGDNDSSSSSSSSRGGGQKQKGWFAEMVKDTGVENERVLIDAAKRAYLSREQGATAAGNDDITKLM